MLSKYLVPVEKEKDSAFDFSIDQAQKLMGKGVEVAGRFTGIEGMEQFGSDIVTDFSVSDDSLVFVDGSGSELTFFSLTETVKN